MQQILIIGKEGQLGTSFYELCRQISWAVFSFTTEKNLNLTDDNAIHRFFSDKKFDFIVNCAAFTAVDKAESAPELTFSLNADAPEKLAIEAAAMNAKIIHISTDYVFGGKHCRPLKPDDPKNPDSVYGQSKLKGEEGVRKSNPASMIVRTSWLYSSRGQNFLKTMLRLGRERESLDVVFDQIGTPTLASDLADAILSIIRKVISNETEFAPGIYHYSNEGVCSWYDFAAVIFDKAGINCKLIPVESDKFPTPAPRPYYSVMDKSLIKEVYGIEIPYWQKSLTRCLQDFL